MTYRSALIIALLPTTAVLGQQPFPTYADSGTWSALQCISGIGTTCITQTFAFADTATFCGHSWSRYSWPGFGWPNEAYLRNEGQRTLLRRSTDCLAKEYLIYDFSMAVGDTVYCALNMDLLEPDTAMFILQDIDTEVLYGVERRRFSMLYDRCNGSFANTPMHWIEGIGSTEHPFYPVDCLCDFCEQGFTLLCYDSSGVQLYQEPFYSTCDTMIVGIHDNAPDPGPLFHAWQDVASGTLLIQFHDGPLPPDAELYLLTADGRLVRNRRALGNGQVTLVVPLQGIAPGVYLLQLHTSKERFAAERIVIE